MLIEVTDKELMECRRLGNRLDSGIIPVNDVRNFLNGIQRKATATAGSPGKRTAIKQNRMNKYKTKIKEHA